MDNSAYLNTQPEEAMSFQDWFSNQYAGSAYENKNPESFNNMFFKGFYDAEKAKYQTYLDNLSTRNEWQATQSAL